MNFYKRFIGDITAKTGGLTLAQFGAYDRLLDHYYSTEQPIPPEEVYSICRAMTKGDRADVDKVLARYWEESPEGWTQSKADEVIGKARPLIEAARENGKKGGRPRKPKTPKEPSGLRNDNPDGTQGEPSAKASQSQSQHSPSLRSGEVSADALGVPPQLLADYRVVRKAKKVGLLTETAADMLRREADKAGVTVMQAIEACCQYGWGGFNAGWYADRIKTAARNGAQPNKHTAAAAAIYGHGAAQPRGEVIDV